MSAARPANPFWIVSHRVKWRLTLSYLLVTLVAILLLTWWGLVVGTIYLQGTNPTRSGLEVIQTQILPALKLILPNALILIIPATLISAYFGFLNARWIDIRLANMRRATQAWQRGDFSIQVTDDAADEISDFGQELNGMAGELERLLSARSDLAALEERNHLARDLHDSVKQQITAASFQIGAAVGRAGPEPRRGPLLPGGGRKPDPCRSPGIELDHFRASPGILPTRGSGASPARVRGWLGTTEPHHRSPGNPGGCSSWTSPSSKTSFALSRKRSPMLPGTARLHRSIFACVPIRESWF